MLPRKRKKTTLTLRVIEGLKKIIKSAPTKSLRRVARESQIPRELVQQVVQEAGWRSLRKVKVPLISLASQATMEERAQGLINALKGVPPGRILFFSNEKRLSGGSEPQSPERLMDSF